MDNYVNVHEETLGLIQLPDTKSMTFFCAMKDILMKCSFPLSLCQGQAFDGAAVLSS